MGQPEGSDAVPCNALQGEEGGLGGLVAGGFMIRAFLHLFLWHKLSLISAQLCFCRERSSPCSRQPWHPCRSWQLMRKCSR